MARFYGASAPGPSALVKILWEMAWCCASVLGAVRDRVGEGELAKKKSFFLGWGGQLEFFLEDRHRANAFPARSRQQVLESN